MVARDIRHVRDTFVAGPLQGRSVGRSYRLGPSRPERVHEGEPSGRGPEIPEIDFLYARCLVIEKQRIVANQERGVGLLEHGIKIGRHDRHFW